MPREAGLFQALTATDRLAELLPILHQQAIAAVDGRSSLLFQVSRGGDSLHATSASGVDRLPEVPWPGRTVPGGLFQNRTPFVLTDARRVVPGAGEHPGANTAVLVPLVRRDEPMGVLVIECDGQPTEVQLGAAGSVGHAFVLALERARAAADADLHRHLRELLQAFARDVSGTTLPSGLEALCDGTNRLFGAHRTSVWLHDRRQRTVVLSASSDGAYFARGGHLPVSDPAAPPAFALRRECAEIAEKRIEADGSISAMLTVPLRGRRRALGALIMEGVRVEPGAHIDLVDRADEMGRQVSSAVENVLLLERVVQSDKLAALGQVVAGIAHELNNPLQGVLGHLELLRTTGAFPKALRRDMQRIYREADRAAKIVTNLLAFAGSRRLVRRPTSINAMLSRVLALRGPAFRAGGIQAVRRFDDGLPRVKVDPLLVHQALLNIVLNAEQAVGAGGGRIELRTWLQHDGGPQVAIEIRDSGPGIPAAAIPRLFEPFFTTKEVGKGTGLGLAITYGIIQEHGGHIAAANHPEGGAVFTVHLPVETG